MPSLKFFVRFVRGKIRITGTYILIIFIGPRHEAEILRP